MTLLAGGAFYQHVLAAASGSSAFDISPNPAVVGTNGTYRFQILNTSSFPQDSETVTLSLITGYPACNVIDFGFPGTPPCDQVGDQNAGVFSPVGTGIGLAGTACGGTTFTVTESISGLWTFTPAVPVVLQPSNLGGGNPLTTCVIQGVLSVDGLPGGDSNAIVPGLQTEQVSYAQGTTSGQPGFSPQRFTGSGSAEISVKGRPTIATTSNPTGTGVAPGTSVTDTVTLSGSGAVPTGNVTFFLCQPAAVTAGGCESGGTAVGAATALVGGAATSVATTNTTALGKYCWRVEYAGDAVYTAGSHTNATTECFTVEPRRPTIATTSNPTGAGVAPGTSVTDTATVSGSGPTPTGNVTFFLCQPAAVTSGGCTTGGTQVGAATALVGGTATSVATTNTTATGKYCWRVEYAGDTVYAAGSHTNATTECFTVVAVTLEGCTPGFWRQSQHFDSWTGVTPSTSFFSVFGRNITVGDGGKAPISTPTMLQAVTASGGGVSALARHAVAAYLNAASSGVDFPFTTTQVIQIFQTAYDSGSATTIEATKNRLAAANEAGCPLS